jgi:hypothetical protein
MLKNNYYKLKLYNKYSLRLLNLKSRLNEINIAFHPDSVFALYIDVFPLTAYFTYLGTGFLIYKLYMKYYHTTIYNKLKKKRLIRQHFFQNKKYHQVKTYSKLSTKLSFKEFNQRSPLTKLDDIVQEEILGEIEKKQQQIKLDLINDIKLYKSIITLKIVDNKEKNINHVIDHKIIDNLKNTSP